MISLVFIIVALTQYAQAVCNGGCSEPTSIYEDIGCKPIYDSPDDCCPVKYDCGHMAKKPNGTCFLQGVPYEIQESVPQDLTYSSCQVGCKCFDRDGPQFVCASLQCPPTRVQPGCLPKYELNKCCSVGHNCQPFDDLAKCIVNNKTYIEGERFYPEKDSCVECVCQKDFKGEFIEPFCQKIKCHAELRHARDIENNCAVVYTGSGKCCPYTFHCPEENDNIIKTSRTIEGGSTCKFGEKVLNVGDRFEKVEVINNYDTAVTKCQCSVPPLVTCVYEHVINKEKVPEHLKQYYN